MVKLRQLLCACLLCSILMISPALAQTTLTQIRDTVLNSDGSPFNGTVVITWNGFTGPAGGTTSPLSTSARIYGGALSVLLVPTSSSTGAFYQAVYNSNDGTATWSETWQVNVSSTPLALNQVRTSSTQGGGGTTGGGGGGTGGGGTGGGPQYAVLPITISEVTSLGADLASINSAVAALATQVSSLGSAQNTSASFIDGEAPGGIVNGANTTFTLAQAPSPASSLSVYRNGLLQSIGIDYTFAGSTINFLSLSTPRTGDVLAVFYRVPGTGPVTGFTDFEIPGGNLNGINLTFTLAQGPAPPASLKLYKNGVLLMPNADYTLSGSTLTFASPNVTPQTGDSLVASYRH